METPTNQSNNTKRPNKTLLIGPPGSGKTEMIAKTAVRRPVHFVDIDNKIGSSVRLAPLIASGDVTFVDVMEPYMEESIIARIKQLTTNEKLTRQPRGWQVIAEKIERLPKTEEGKRAGTWAFDSLTLGLEHLKTLISFYAQKNKYQFDQWTAFLSGCRDTIKVIVDIAMENDKDIVMTVHEKVREEVGDRVTGIKLERVASSDGSVSTRRDIQGTMDVKILPTIDGQFAGHIGAYFDDIYALSVEMVNGHPKWVCRVQPDGRRDLRCSFPVDKEEFDPDFRQIWGVKK